MDRSNTTPRISKAQRESHSEIERKRRERMKRDTEFLRKQVSNSQCKDKLSIFQAGAEKLIQYTDKLGKREYIINDEEYSRIIMTSFDGFDIQIRCSDGVILKVHPNVEKILDFPVNDILGRTLYDIAEPSSGTKQLITDAFHGSNFQWEFYKGLIARNFTIALHCGPAIPPRHCIYGTDGNVYRFIEFCGDLLHQNDPTSSQTMILFRGLCRPLDPACSTVISKSQFSSPGGTGNSISSNDKRQPRTQYHFTLRLYPTNMLITEAVGDVQELLGCSAEYLLRKHLSEIVTPSERTRIDWALEDVLIESPRTLTVQLVHTKTNQPMPFEAVLSAIRVGSHLHCIICRLNAIETPGLETEVIQSVKSEVTVVAQPAQHPCGDKDQSASPSRKVYQTPTGSGGQSFSLDLLDDEINSMAMREDLLINQVLEKNASPKPFHADNMELVNENLTALSSAHSKYTDANNPQSLTVDPESSKDFCCPVLPKQLITTPALESDPNQHSNEESDEWFKNVDTSSFQSLLNNCHSSVETLLPEYLMDVLRDGSGDL
ncbi:unnamed protein product [Calicophoron daubneyi]|uniref:BHLH domain-containing protein n=1 Tax=Calicophoron daubneyi TaxID=300641 RepID=A0AAV2THK0_CALDB